MTAKPHFELEVRPEWMDYNGHMNVAYYVLAFDQATDAMYELWDTGEAYLARGFSLFTLAMNVDYFRELLSGDMLRIESRLIDVDHKRVHYVHEMYHQGSNELAASNECLCMNVSMATRRSTPFPPEICASLQRLLQARQDEPLPEFVGRKLRIRR